MFEKIQKGNQPYTNPAMGQFYIEELNLITPYAPEPDRDESGVAHWNIKGFHAYNQAVTQTTLDIIERQVEENGMKSLYPYPHLPALPVADLTLDGTWYYCIETMMKHAKMVVKRFIAYAIEETIKQASPKVEEMNPKSVEDTADFTVPCGTVVMIPNTSRAMDKVCKDGNLCAACQEIIRLRNIIDEIANDKLSPDEMAKARLAAVVRDFTATSIPTQDPKYVIIGGKLCNAKTGVSIPADEPIMIFRGKDKTALSIISIYAGACGEGPHADAVKAQVDRFTHFAHNEPDRMKTPDT